MRLTAGHFTLAATASVGRTMSTTSAIARDFYDNGTTNSNSDFNRYDTDNNDNKSKSSDNYISIHDNCNSGEIQTTLVITTTIKIKSNSLNNPNHELIVIVIVVRAITSIMSMLKRHKARLTLYKPHRHTNRSRNDNSSRSW